MRIIEVFHSLQGEGPYSGFRTSFIRTARCNLRCTWCDTTYSFGPGVERSIPSLLEEVAAHGTHYACLTGGEPLLQREAPQLLRALARKGYTTVVETGGSLDVSGYLAIPRTALSVDVKCPSSGMQRRNRLSNLALLRKRDVLKFVVADRTDLEFSKNVLEANPVRATVVFQPVWGSDSGALADWVLAERLDVRFLLQEHKHLWGEQPGR